MLNDLDDGSNDALGASFVFCIDSLSKVMITDVTSL
jgi:hypothetical protein